MEDFSKDNSYLKESLLEFLNKSHAPPYAILIKGKWGSGKTHIVKAIVDAYIEKQKGEGQVSRPEPLTSAACIVSLADITSVEALEKKVRESLYKVLTNKVSTKVLEASKQALVGAFRKGTEKLTGNAMDISALLPSIEVLPLDRADIYVFDDLERCQLDIITTMSFINRFVETHKKKVIVIADEEKIKSDANYLQHKEKLVGFTLEAFPVFDDAFESFIKEGVAPNSVSFLRDKKETIRAVFMASQLHNLRSLRSLMIQFDKLFEIIEEKHKNHTTGMLKLLSLFFAIGFEVKSGEITPNDLFKMDNESCAKEATFSSNEEARQKKPKKVELCEKYETLNLRHSDMRSMGLGEIIIGIFAFQFKELGLIFDKSLFRKEEINDFLSSNPLFMTEAEKPEWVIVWERIRTGDTERTVSATKIMEEKYAKRIYETDDEVLHVTGLRLSLFADSILSELKPRITIDQILNEGIEYLNHLAENDKIKPLDKNDHLGQFKSRSALDMSFSSEETSEFQKLIKHAQKLRQESADQAKKKKISELMILLEHNPKEFFNIVFVYGYPGRYHIDNFNLFSANALAKILHDMKNYEYRPLILQAIEKDILRRNNKDEKIWAKKVADQMRAYASNAYPQSKDSLKHAVHISTVKNYLAATLDHINPS